MKKILSIVVVLALTACTGSEVKSSLGLKRRSPDEFMVLSRPALTVPPQFDLPDPSTNRAPKDFSSNNAKQALFGTKTTTVTKTTTKIVKAKPGSNAEDLFLNKAGASDANSNIRDLIEEDVRAAEPAPEVEEPGFFARTFESIQPEETKPDPVVNPIAEKERIKASKERGETISGDNTATVQPKSESVIDKIF